MPKRKKKNTNFDPDWQDFIIEVTLDEDGTITATPKTKKPSTRKNKSSHGKTK